nr:hypothetical protein [uncultured bacterium]
MTSVNVQCNVFFRASQICFAPAKATSTQRFQNTQAHPEALTTESVPPLPNFTGVFAQSTSARTHFLFTPFTTSLLNPLS